MEKDRYFNHYAISYIPKAPTEHIRRKFVDLEYGNQSPSQKLDVYLPDEGEGPFPVIIAVHGGAFMGGDKGDIQVIPMLEGLERGYAVVSINYRLSHEAKFPALVHDAKAAVRWVRANAQRFGFDPERIAAWGGSAGGYVSSFLGVSRGVSELEDLSIGHAAFSSDVQAVVAWFGPSNFLTMDQQLEESGLAPKVEERHNGPNSPESLLLGQTITEVPELVTTANPETYITEGVPPFLLQHGTRDSTVPFQQSVEFAHKLDRALGSKKVRLTLLENKEHADDAFGAPENLEIVFAFLDQHLK